MNKIQSIHYWLDPLHAVAIARKGCSDSYPICCYRKISPASRKRLRLAIRNAVTNGHVSSVYIDIGDGRGSAVWMRLSYYSLSHLDQGRVSLISGGKGAPPEIVSVILVIKAGVLRVSRVFGDESLANAAYEVMKVEYDIDPLDPDTPTDDNVLHLREEVSYEW